MERLRLDFPALHVKRNGKSLVYLDNAATSQKPKAVIERLDQYYRSENANVHRGMHYLSEVATAAYEDARKKVQRFLGIPLTCEVVFTRGTTEGINLVAQTYGRKNVGPDDEIIISAMEHHSNIVPWQMLCDEKGAKLRVVPVDDRGELVLDEYARLLNGRTKLVAVTHVSNALGTVNPVKEIIALAHAQGVPVLLDGAQATPHLPVNVQALDCDFYACSAHKMFGPTGIGVLYGKAEFLNRMPPYQGGGDMILSVTFEKTTYSGLPYKFEAGTPDIAGAIGLGEAVDYLEAIGMRRIAKYEHELTQYGTELLSSIDGVRIIGTAKEKAGVLSFTMESAHPHDIGQIFNDCGVAIRAGHHCAQPVMQRFGVPATARASLAFYNTKEDLDALAVAVHKVKEVFD
ncbi:MAG: cysteine desulfurase [Candidatus Hydrogenedentes bacterium]|nr:cysteine desulfurase [Candidatus Hydrogenedentota bacterium]